MPEPIARIDAPVTCRVLVRIVLFDAILERHVCESLERALGARGHDVTWTGPIWHGHRLPHAAADRDRIRSRIDEICREGADALLCLRASALHPELVERLDRHGIHTMVWLPDDPVLYQICYRHIVGAYRTVLHCGGESILRFYENEQGRPTGINFPFWTDAEAFPHLYDPDRAEVDVVFLGNCAGDVRRARYDFISSLPFRTRIHGRVEADPAGIAGGFLDGTAEVAAALARARVGLNLSQWFRDYGGGTYDFPGLARLGHFQYPSRVIQYAAVGLPVLSFSDPDAHDSFPEQITSATRGEWVERARRLLAEPGLLARVAQATHARFVKSFSADARAALIERAVEEPGFWRPLALEERARLFAGEESDARAPVGAGTLLPRRKRVLVSGYYGAQNSGDELILRSIVDRVRRSAPEIEISVASEHPDRVEKVHPVSAFRRRDHAACAAEASNASALVLGGGGIWHDYSFEQSGGIAGLFSGDGRSVTGFSQLPLLARALGLDLHIFGVGAGPLTHDDAIRLVRFVASLARTASVRDESSRRLLASPDASGPSIAVHPDPVFALDLGNRTVPPQVNDLKRGGRVLAVNVRPWELGAGPALMEELAGALREVAVRHPDVALLGLPMQGGSARDRRALADLFDRVTGARAKVVLPWTPRFDELFGALAASDALVAMRLHACLLAHRLGTPAVGIEYDPKIAEHFAQVGAASRLLPLDATSPRIAEAVDSILASAGESPVTPARIAELEAEAARGLDELVLQLQAASPRLRSTAIWPQTPPKDRASQPAVPALRPPDELLRRVEARWPYWGEDGRLAAIWHCPRRGAAQRTDGAPDKLRVVADERATFYLAARGTGSGFASPPTDPAAWAVEAEALCHLRFEVAIEGDLSVALWIIEYSRDTRVCHTQQALRSGTAEVTWRTSPTTGSIRVALRFEGTGSAVLGPVGFAGSRGQ
jgi:polysaccharide pyruvyl transferase CsaB